MNNQEIVETGTGDQKANTFPGRADIEPSPIHRQRRWLPLMVTVGLMAVGGVGFWIILWASGAFSEVGVAVNFVVVNTLSLLVLLAIVAQVCVYWSQRRVMRQQWQAMQDGLSRTDDMIKKMEAQTEVAKDSVEASDRALRASQRAYVGLQRDPKLTLRFTEYPEVEVYFVNTGRTPAHVVEFRYKFSSDKEGTNRFIEYQGVKKDFFIFAGTPKRVHCVWNLQPLDDEWLQRIENKDSTIYFAGRLVYEDVWGTHNFDTEVVRFEYFSFGTHQLRENYKGDQDYAQQDFIVELDGTEETIDEPPWDREPDEPPDYDPFEI